MPSLPGSVRWRLAYLSWVLLSGRHSRTFGAPSLLLKSQWNRQRSKSLWPVWLVLHWWVWSLCKLQPGRSFGRLQASYACQAVYLCHCCLHGGSFPGLQASRGHFQSCNLQVEAAIQRRAWQQNQRGPQGEHEPAAHSFAGSRRRGREFFRPLLSKAIEHVCFPARITGVCRKIEACHYAGRRAERFNLLRRWSISQPQRHQLVLLSTEAPFHHSFLILGLKEPPDQDVLRCEDFRQGIFSHAMCRKI